MRIEKTDYPFNHVISLGYNCEISFRIEDYFGKLDSTIFSWSYILDRNQFLNALANIDDIFEHGVSLADDHMFVCDKYRIKFHPRYDIIPKKGDYSDYQFERAYNELVNRIKYLKKKSIGVFKDNRKKVFIIKVQDFGECDNISFIQGLFKCVNRMCTAGNFELMCVLEKKTITKKILQLENENIKIRTVLKFAPVKYTNIGGDYISWYKILAEASGGKGSLLPYFWNAWKRRTIFIPGAIIYKIKNCFRR